MPYALAEAVSDQQTLSRIVAAPVMKHGVNAVAPAEWTKTRSMYRWGW